MAGPSHAAAFESVADDGLGGGLHRATGDDQARGVIASAKEAPAEPQRRRNPPLSGPGFLTEARGDFLRAAQPAEYLQTHSCLQAAPGGSGVSFSPDGTTLASGSEAGRVKLWDTSEWTRPPPIRASENLGR